MNLSLTQEEIFNYLSKKKWEPIFQKETGQSYILWKINNSDIHVFFVIIGQGMLLQTIAYFPFTYHDNVRTDLARLLHLLNKDVDMPGFGMDENEKVIFYRSVIPCMQKTFDPQLLDSYLYASKTAIETFFGTIGVIATGSAQLDDLIEESKKSNFNRPM